MVPPLDHAVRDNGHPDELTDRAEVEALIGRVARRLEEGPPGPVPCTRCGTRRNDVQSTPEYSEPLCEFCFRARYLADVEEPAGDGQHDGVRLTSSADLLVNMDAAIELADEPIAYAIDPIAARGFLTVLAGRTTSFKSWLMMLTGHVAHRGGGEVAGLRSEQTTVLYVDAENGPRLMGRRFKDAGIPSNGLLVADGTKLRLPRDGGRLRDLIETTGAGLVVLDSLRRLAPRVRENESDDMAAVIADIGTIARDLDVAIVLIHHRSTKPGAATLRGSSTIEDQADLVFVLEHVTGDPDRQRRRLKAVKYRIDADPGPVWLRMGRLGRVGLFAVSAAEPYEGGGDDRDDGGQSADERLADRIDALAGQVRTDGGWTPARLATAVGSSRDSGTFKRALKLLTERGTWEGIGSGRARRLCPSGEPGQLGQPLGNGPVGPVEAEAGIPLAPPELGAS